MKIWYVDAWHDQAGPELSQRHLFPSKAEAAKYYHSLVRDAKERLKDEYEENGGTFLDGSPRPKEWLDQDSVISEACALEPQWLSIPSRPTKAQIIQTFDCW